MIKKVKNGGIFNIPIHEYYCDTKDEMTVIEMVNKPPMGSSCFCFEDKSVYLVDGTGKFVKI
jgi:hypothetical protein